MLQPASIVGEPRFVMLETIREYALERLEESGEEIDARRAHVAYFRTRAQEAESALRGPLQQQWRDALESDLDDLRSRVGVDPECVRGSGGRRKRSVDGWLALVFLVPAWPDG